MILCSYGVYNAWMTGSLSSTKEISLDSIKTLSLLSGKTVTLTEEDLLFLLLFREYADVFKDL